MPRGQAVLLLPYGPLLGVGVEDAVIAQMGFLPVAARRLEDIKEWIRRHDILKPPWSFFWWKGGSSLSCKASLCVRRLNLSAPALHE